MRSRPEGSRERKTHVDAFQTSGFRRKSWFTQFFVHDSATGGTLTPDWHIRDFSSLKGGVPSSQRAHKLVRAAQRITTEALPLLPYVVALWRPLVVGECPCHRERLRAVRTRARRRNFLLKGSLSSYAMCRHTVHPDDGRLPLVDSRLNDFLGYVAKRLRHHGSHAVRLGHCMSI